MSHSITFRIAVGPQRGCKAFALQTLPACDPYDSITATAGNIAGFPLLAGVAAKAHERKKLERLCRYISRRWYRKSACRKQVRYELKTPIATAPPMSSSISAKRLMRRRRRPNAEHR